MHVFRMAAQAIGATACTIALLLCPAGAVVVWAASPPKTTGGTIKGTVRIKGEAPRIEALKITKDQDVCKDVPNEALIVSSDRGVQNVVIVLEGLPKSARSRETAHPVFRLTNWQCRFAPHVSVMQVDDDLEISNLDPILHTAKALQSQVNVGLYPGRALRRVIGAPALGPLKITCEIHPWMLAWVFLTDNPYYAVSDVHGEYQIEDVPPGKYRLKFWHELLGTQVVPVEVSAGKTIESNVSLSAERPGAR